jgi:hypothetical protein
MSEPGFVGFLGLGGDSNVCFAPLLTLLLCVNCMNGDLQDFGDCEEMYSYAFRELSGIFPLCSLW